MWGIIFWGRQMFVEWPNIEDDKSLWDDGSICLQQKIQN